MTTNWPPLSAPAAELIPRARWSGSAQSNTSVIGAAPYRRDEPGAAGQIAVWVHVFEKPWLANQFDGRRRRGVVVLDGEQSAGAQPPPGLDDEGGYHRHAVRPAEQRMWRIMLSHLGFQHGIVGNVWRVGDDEVDQSVEFGKQAAGGDVGAHEFHRM